MGYEATEQVAYRAAKEHRASILADLANILPLPTPIYKGLLRPMAVDAIVTALNGQAMKTLDLIQTVEPIGYVD
jgi:hypothetical protein